MTTPARHTARVSDMAGVLACVPTLIGFHPARSLVALCLARGRVVLSMRADLDGSDVDELARMAVMAARRSDADELILVGYVPNVGTVIREVLRDLALTIESRTVDDEQPLFVRHLAAVGRDGWCELPDWGDDLPELRPLAEVENHPVHVQRIFDDGRLVATSRDALFDRVRPGSDPLPDGFALAFKTQMEAMSQDSAADLFEQLAGLLDACREHRQVPDGQVMGRLAALVTRSDVRDAATIRIDGETTLWLDLWSGIARCTDGQTAAMPLALAGLASWVRGDGALANICCDLVAELQPDNPLAGIVRSVVENCLPPELWTTFAQSLVEDGVIPGARPVEAEPS